MSFSLNICLKLFTIFLNIKILFSENFLDQSNREILNNIISAYNISNVFIAVPDNLIIESFIDSLHKNENITLNIHSNDFNGEDKFELLEHDSRELVIVT